MDNHESMENSSQVVYRIGLLLLALFSIADKCIESEQKKDRRRPNENPLTYFFWLSVFHGLINSIVAINFLFGNTCAALLPTL